MPTLKTSSFKIIEPGPTRTCPECETPELEITADLNIFECNYCGAIWHRIKPQMIDNGTMVNLPRKLQNLLKRQK